MMSGANASPRGRSHQMMSGANASPRGRSHQMKEVQMRRYIIAVLIAGAQLWLTSSAALSQEGPWKPCPRCQTNAQRAAAAKNDKTHPFDAHDLSGIWGRQGIALSNEVPPMTAWGKAKY